MVGEYFWKANNIHNRYLDPFDLPEKDKPVIAKMKTGIIAVMARSGSKWYFFSDPFGKNYPLNEVVEWVDFEKAE